jgi:hypothetical protein
MNDQPAMFTVTIDGLHATLHRIKPGKRGYDKARKEVILRERDAIALFNQHVTEGQPLDGVYSFQSMDIAKTFAFLHLKSLERLIAADLDRVQGFDGGAKARG